MHLITGLPVGGTEMMLLRLGKALRPLGVESVIVSLTDKGRLGERFEKDGLDVHCLDLRMSFPQPLRLYQLLRLLDSAKPDVLQTWLYHADFFGILATRFRPVPLIWNIRCSELNSRTQSNRSSLFLSGLARLARFPRAVVVNSEAGKMWHESLGYRPRRWEVIANGFDLDTFRPSLEQRDLLRRELKINSGAVLIGLIARFDPLKDHENFLRAARGVLNRYPDVHFVLAGPNVDSANGQLVQLISSVDLGDRIHLLGERSDIAEIDQALDIAASSSYSEGFSNTLAEAMACGIPCAATNVGDAEGLLGATGIVVRPGDPDALASALCQLIEMSPEDRRSLGALARSRIQSLFAIDKIASRYASLYREICAGDLM